MDQDLTELVIQFPNVEFSFIKSLYVASGRNKEMTIEMLEGDKKMKLRKHNTETVTVQRR